MKEPMKKDEEWAYFGKEAEWEDVEKPAELTSIPRCTICELAVELEKWQMSIVGIVGRFASNQIPQNNIAK